MLILSGQLLNHVGLVSVYHQRSFFQQLIHNGSHFSRPVRF